MRDIAGWISYSRRAPKIENGFAAIEESMTRSRLDIKSTWIKDHIALTCRATAGIGSSSDISLAKYDADGLAILYCGMPDTVRLRDRLLSQGYSLSGATLWDVLTKGYYEYDTHIAEFLDGKFVLAIWDNTKSRLLIVRDRCGNQPVYYYLTDDGLIFGTEITSILSSRLVKRTIGIAGLRELLLPVHSAGMSIWEGVYEVEPGNFLVLDPDGIRTETYWKLPAKAHVDQLEDTISETRRLIERSVCSHVSPNVPIHVLLSGGLDSSTIASFVARLQADRLHKVHTCSVEFLAQIDDYKKIDLQVSSDSPHVDEMVRFLDSVHTKLSLDSRATTDVEHRRHLIHSAGVPLPAEMIVSLYLLLSTIRGGPSIVLSGNGSDGLFGGMPSFYDKHRIDEYINPEVFASSYMADASTAWLTSDLIHELDAHKYIYEVRSSEINKIETINDESDRDKHMRQFGYIISKQMSRALGMRDHFVSKAAQVELYAPFSDHSLIEYVFNTPWSFKYFDGKEKSLLRRVAIDMLPESIAHRQKSGYPTTFQYSHYAHELKKQGMAIAAERNHPVFDIVSRNWLRNTVETPDFHVSTKDALKLDTAIGVYHWLELFRPTLSLG